MSILSGQFQNNCLLEFIKFSREASFSQSVLLWGASIVSVSNDIPVCCVPHAHRHTHIHNKFLDAETNMRLLKIVRGILFNIISLSPGLALSNESMMIKISVAVSYSASNPEIWVQFPAAKKITLF